MYPKTERTEIIELDCDIQVVGVSLQKSALPISFESLGKVWHIYGENYRGRDKIANAVSPKTEYAILLNHIPDYIAGHEVFEKGDLNVDCTYTVIPKGRYIKDTFNAESFEHLCEIVLPERNVHAWAEKNSVEINEKFSVEVYPWEEFEKQNFEMYTLTPINEKCE